MNLFETAKSVYLVQIIEKFSGLQLEKRKLSGHSCPICGHNGCFSIFTNNKTGALNYKCFSCGATGDGIDFVCKIKNYAFQSDAAKDICNAFGLVYDEIETNPIPQEQKDYYSCNNYANDFFEFFLHNHKSNPVKYFLDRGLSLETIKSYKLGYLPDLDKFIKKDGTLCNFGVDVLLPKFTKNVIISTHLVNRRGDCIFSGRFIFPILNSKGNPIAFAGRSLSPSVPKYINTSETEWFKKAYTLYNYPVANKYSSVYVVEGYMDALSLVEAGVPNVVASMGTAFGDTHLSCLKGKHITLALDNDGPGLEHMFNIIMSHKDINFDVLKLKGYKDFNEALCAGADIKSLVKKTMPSPLFVIKYIVNTYDMNDINSRKFLWTSLATLIGSPKDDVYRQTYPINTSYTPYEHDYYWTIANRMVKGKRAKKGGE